jgi:hypothetical protein
MVNVIVIGLVVVWLVWGGFLLYLDATGQGYQPPDDSWDDPWL